jgi:secreted Zn-dependent insulinase-like peptidase
MVLLRTPAVAGSARASVLTSLLVELLEDALEAPLAAAAEAGVSWGVAGLPGGLLLQASGYSQHVPRLSRDLAAHLAAFAPDGARFGVKREMLERGLRNRQQELRVTPNP